VFSIKTDTQFGITLKKNLASQHSNPLCRVVPIGNIQEEGKTTPNNYDKEKYRDE
jgi:hypothetical protein